jgi:hypothetical protein
MTKLITVFPLNDFLSGSRAYGVRVSFGSEQTTITAFAKGEDAWDAGVKALGDMIEAQRVAA